MTSQNSDKPKPVYPLTDADIAKLIDYADAEDAPACIRSICEKIKARKDQIILTFEDEETAEYVRLICRRKGTSLENYILDNFEWDDPINCMTDLNEGEKITEATCEGCDQSSHCPDAVKKKAGRS